MHGVAYRTEGNEGRTSVRGTHRQVKRTVPLHLVHRRVPPDVKATLESFTDSECDSGSSVPVGPSQIMQQSIF